MNTGEIVVTDSSNSNNQANKTQEVVVERKFELPPTSTGGMRSAIANNLNQVAKVAANGGVKGIRWVETKPPPKQ